ncbi:Sulfatase [Candidatus Promineifilum breve]|uniref:Sulfatase n=1 Tax=Candidatus Promineifilum breve TaxID=1806508 RepID=A0A160SYR5_9CHLR|nr:sulfatase [Candidatus Promineifilum breve]CUS02651.2 Sulfatase [Candidatus Promineifilum breve]
MTSPDVIFIVLDTQRADRLGCYGHTRPTSPNLDRFAAEGALFERAVSPAQWTIPSHASLFTGLYPTAHGVTQSSQSLSANRPHLAEVMRRLGYETIGFCNNPLVGVLNNGFKRGFQTFYNYGGAFPSVPDSSNPWPWPVSRLAESYTQFLRRISYPIQNFVGRSDLAFRISLHAWLTPLWSKIANFKGQNERSTQDVVQFLQDREENTSDQPLFLFMNLMETHLPFWAPAEFVDRIAPYFRHSKEARAIMRTWNREAYRWAAPLAEPLDELEERVLKDMYDAEVAYQDYYLGALFETLAQRRRNRDTLTIIVADHGDGLGDHNFFGHAFVAYDELVRVPLIMHWPGKVAAETRVAAPVSTRRVFHTILDAAAPTAEQSPALDEALGDDAGHARRLSLRHTLAGRDPEQETAFSEIYPPLNFVKAIESRQPELLARYRCLSPRRAVVRPAREDAGAPLKLITVDDTPEELYNLAADPPEMDNRLAADPLVAAALALALDQMAQRAAREHEAQPAGATVELDGDELLRQRLRGLGYLE